jgi:hypothetical protein
VAVGLLEKDPDWRVQEPMPEYLTDFVRKPQYALGPMSRRWGWPLRAGAIFWGPALPAVRSLLATGRGTATRCRVMTSFSWHSTITAMSCLRPLPV